MVTAFAFHPSRSSSSGLPNSTAQFATVPDASRTSMNKKAFGLTQSTLVTTPCNLTSRLLSYVVENDCWGNAVAAVNSVARPAAKTLNKACFIVFTLIPGQFEITFCRALRPRAGELAMIRADIVQFSFGRNVDGFA